MRHLSWHSHKRAVQIPRHQRLSLPFRLDLRVRRFYAFRVKSTILQLVLVEPLADDLPDGRFPRDSHHGTTGLEFYRITSFEFHDRDCITQRFPTPALLRRGIR